MLRYTLCAPILCSGYIYKILRCDSLRSSLGRVQTLLRAGARCSPRPRCAWSLHASYVRTRICSVRAGRFGRETHAFLPSMDTLPVERVMSPSHTCRDWNFGMLTRPTPARRSGRAAIAARPVPRPQGRRHPERLAALREPGCTAAAAALPCSLGRADGDRTAPQDTLRRSRS